MLICFNGKGQNQPVGDRTCDGRGREGGPSLCIASGAQRASLGPDGVKNNKQEGVGVRVGGGCTGFYKTSLRVPDDEEDNLNLKTRATMTTAIMIISVMMMIINGRMRERERGGKK